MLRVEVPKPIHAGPLKLNNPRLHQQFGRIRRKLVKTKLKHFLRPKTKGNYSDKRREEPSWTNCFGKLERLS